MSVLAASPTARPQASQAQGTPPVRVDRGVIAGAVEDGVTVFRGIPYAAPPVDDRRWKAPQPVVAWEGTRSATAFGPACMQTNGAIAHLPAPSEDCLFANVWTPARPPDRLPVMVWNWTNFAKTRSPNGAGLPEWPAFTGAAPRRVHRSGQRASGEPLA